MDQIIFEQKSSLKELCERLNEKFIAARLSEDGRILTVLLPEIIEGLDLFTDIVFYPQDERMDDISFCAFRTEIADMSEHFTFEGDDIPPDIAADILGFSGNISVVNSMVPIGGYGLETTDGALPFKMLMFNTVVPLIPAIRGKRLTDTLESTLNLVHESLEVSLDQLVHYEFIHK